MKLSDILAKKAERLWQEAANKPFVTEMAMGTLSRERFRNYMLQDYLYLLDYIDILKNIPALADDPGTADFLTGMIEETENELYRVHIPNMKKYGITDRNIAECKKSKVITEYTGYMRKVIDEYGFPAGLTALLQCSWVYAFIGQTLKEKYPDEISRSPYRDWFDAYTCHEYTETNRLFINALDKKCPGTDSDLTGTLCIIFETCAEYENKFWDELYDYMLAR